MKQYEGFINYNEYSGYGFSKNTLEEAKKDMLAGIDFYKGIGANIKDATIQAYCDKCRNEGFYKVRRPRSIKTVKCECNQQYINDKCEFIIC